ncbi:MAG TPA: DUF4845 domain-containing protein [Thiotrichales bacterium]|nr:DUF4845 domain-containing protein [Thiotrichales bacterium]
MHQVVESRQRGMTFIGWVVTLAIVGFFVLLTLRLLPGYLEYFKIKGVLESLEKEPNITQASKAEIRKLIARRLDINSVDDVTAKDFRIEKRDGRLVVRIDYEVRVPVLGNVDAVQKFHDQIELIRH